MEKKKIRFMLLEPMGPGPQMKISTPDSMAMMSPQVLRNFLKDLITHRETHLEIDLSGIHTMDNEWFDTFNFLSRLARKYGSSITLTGVESEVMEIIELIRKYYFFDIRVVEPA